MEYRKYYNTPREHIDNDLLLRILDEKDPVNCNYGNSYRQGSCRRNDVNTSCCENIPTPRREQNDCNACDEKCAKVSPLSGYALAMAYIPDQEWADLFNEDDAINHGTIFTELCKPFYHGCAGSCR